jgi:Ca2+-binding RTX toxin-like protein
VDTNPTAVADAAAVAFSGNVGGNLLFNDLSVDMPRSVTSVSFDGSSHAIASGGSTTIETTNGTLTVSSDGSYSYASHVSPTAVLTGGSLAAWEQTTDLYAFPSGSTWQNGSGLNLAALDSNAAGNATWVGSGAKSGVGVAGGGDTLGKDEQLIVHLHETAVHATIAISQLNANQGLVNAHWSAYDANGGFVSSGDFAGAPLNNGNAYAIDIDTGGQAFSYLRFSWSGNSQGFALNALEIERLPVNHSDSFGYTMRDGDGDLASSTLTVTPGTTSGTQGAVLDGGTGGDYLVGDARDNTLAGHDNNDVLYGNAGNDTHDGGLGHDLLNGGAGNDVLFGGAGRDILVGGAGNDALNGGGGADVFAWNLADRGAAGAPARDTVQDFNLSGTISQSGDADVLDLRDLLQGEQNATSLDRYLEFDTTSQPGSTLIHISSAGNFTAGAGWSAAQAASEDQTVVLQGIADIRSALSLAPSASDNAVIQELVNSGKLLIDHGA